MGIKVCDALCGSGKTSACIRMMNENKDKKYVFVTQFLSEVDRIIRSCKERNFVSPISDVCNRRKTKLSDLQKLLYGGQNIATTHALFVNCTDEIKDYIRQNKYVLVLDETVDIMRMSELKNCDIDLLEDVGVIEDRDGFIHWTYPGYEAMNANGKGLFSEEMYLAKSRNLLTYDGQVYFWSLPPELFECFDEVYVLTYLFNAQLLRCFFDLYKLPYELIGVKPDGDSYIFCDANDMDRTRELRDKIHILDHKKLNAIGGKRYDLSYSHLMLGDDQRKAAVRDQLRKNLGNLFRNIYHAPCSQIMWTTFKECKHSVEGKGYTSGFVPYSKRASNEFSGRHYLAYCVNNFLRPWEANYYKEHGVEMDNDAYGLSFLIQWVFRSAIRNGEEIWVYIPSVRMRNLFTQWLDNLAEGKDLEPVCYQVRRKKYCEKRKDDSDTPYSKRRKMPEQIKKEKEDGQQKM